MIVFYGDSLNFSRAFKMAHNNKFEKNRKNPNLTPHQIVETFYDILRYPETFSVSGILSCVSRVFSCRTTTGQNSATQEKMGKQPNSTL